MKIASDLWFAHLDGAVVLSLHALRVDLQVQLAHPRRYGLLDHVVEMYLRDGLGIYVKGCVNRNHARSSAIVPCKLGPLW